MNHKDFNSPLEILLVEDSPDDIFLFKEVLKDVEINIKLSVVTDGRKALDFIYKKEKYADAPTPDIILLDLNLPKVDGREVLNIVKSDENIKMIPVIVLTTSQNLEDINQAYLKNANCYIAKPVDLEQFTNVLTTIEDFWLNIVRLPHSE